MILHAQSAEALYNKEESMSNLYNYKAKVVKVVDGDTVDVVMELGFDISYSARVRLLGINTPESRTKDLVEKAAGLEAKDFVVQWLEDRDNIVILSTQLDGKGKFGRVLGMICDKDTEEVLNETLVKEGHAVHYDGGKR